MIPIVSLRVPLSSQSINLKVDSPVAIRSFPYMLKCTGTRKEHTIIIREVPACSQSLGQLPIAVAIACRAVWYRSTPVLGELVPLTIDSNSL